MKYIFRGGLDTAYPLKGMACDPVLDRRGKCIRGRNGNMLVVDANGKKHVVPARQLRKQP